MKNIAFRVPGDRVVTTYFASGGSSSTVTPGSRQVILLNQTSYVGTRPKTSPPPKNYYALNQQRIALGNTSTYVYTSSRTVASGAGLDTTVQGCTLYPTYDWTALRNRCLEKLTDQVRGSLDLSIDLAEAHKTAKMLDLSNKVVDYTRVFTRKFGALKAASNAWLEYTYGIKPLVQSVYGAADESLRTVINKTERHRARVSEKFVPTTCGMHSIVGFYPFPVVKSDIKVSMTIGVDIRTDQFDMSRWTSLNPVSIAWELLPYSFVVDWFLNVGGYLRNMETYLLNANKFRSGYETTLAVGKLGVQLVDEGVGGSSLSHVSNWTGSLEFTDIVRNVLTTYPAPTLPSFKVSLGSSRLTSAAALLAQALESGGNPVPRSPRLSRAVQRTVGDQSQRGKVFYFPKSHAT